MARRLVFFIPLLLVAVLLGFFFVGLQRDPTALPSVLLDRPVPPFDLPGLPGREPPLTGPDDLVGDVVLLNFFGSWCIACLQEHPTLARIQQTGLVDIHGIAFKDQPDDTLRWLNRHGDVYDRVGYDTTNRIAIEFGVSGAPETFVIDADGVIRYKYVGPITDAVWAETLRPLIESLRQDQG